MKDQYVGDVGDYVKLGLIRHLNANRLGVIWCRSEGDGKHISCLCDDGNRKHDPDLFDELKKIIHEHKVVCKGKGRRIERLEKILPEASFYGKEIKAGNEREKWFNDACKQMNGCDLVFVDPDKGMTMNEKPSKEHISIEEVKKLAKKHSLLIYHSFSYNEKHEGQIRKWQGKLKGLSGDPRAIRSGKLSPRAFFLVSKKKSFNDAFKEFAEKWKTFGVSCH